MGQLSPWATTTEPLCLEPVLHSERSPLSATEQSPCPQKPGRARTAAETRRGPRRSSRPTGHVPLRVQPALRCGPGSGCHLKAGTHPLWLRSSLRGLLKDTRTCRLGCPHKYIWNFLGCPWEFSEGKRGLFPLLNPRVQNSWFKAGLPGYYQRLFVNIWE